MSRNGLNKERRIALRQWVLDEYGDGVVAPCVFCDEPLTDETMTLDRIIPGALGGRYYKENVQPACADCNVARGHGQEEPPLIYSCG